MGIFSWIHSSKRGWKIPERLMDLPQGTQRGNSPRLPMIKNEKHAVRQKFTGLFKVTYHLGNQISYT